MIDTTYIPVISDVQIVVARHFDLDRASILGRDRRKTTALARHLVAFIAKYELGMSYPEIARASMREDHTTAMASVRNVRNLIAARDPATRQHLIAILSELGLPLERRAA